MRRLLWLKAAMLVIVMSSFSCERGAEQKPGYLKVSPDGAQSVAAADTGVTFNVESDLAWDVAVAGDGFSADRASGSGNAAVVVTFGENPSTAHARTGKVTFTAIDENAPGGKHTVSVEITQAKKTAVEPGYLAVFIDEDDVAFDTRSIALSIETDMEWRITARHLSPEFSTPWQITPSSEGGEGYGEVALRFEVNYEYDRQAEVTVTAGDLSRSVTIMQRGRLGGTDFPQWSELPSIELDPNTFFYTHYTQLNGERVRNYSVFYDRSTYISYWIAYPLHRAYTIKNTARTDAWSYDPMLPQSYQTGIKKGYGDYDRLKYDKGHQVASADRLATREMNEQTFYSTNMTPQKANLNQGTWAGLEDFLRTHAEKIQDTVWVVTGAVLRTESGNEQITYITNVNDNKQIPVPNYYYKVALKKKAGNSYTSIGFWMEHHNNYSSGDSYRNYIKTVRDIERLTGFDFFANLPVSEQDAFETVVGDGWF